MTGLEQAIVIATKAHLDQSDKHGNPYILHPLRVMLAVPPGYPRIVAVLHDVIEDCPEHWTLGRLQDHGFAPEIIAAVDAISQRRREPYAAYLDRVAANPLATMVKIADLQDWLSVAYDLPHPPTRKDRDRVRKYLNALKRLGGRFP